MGKAEIQYLGVYVVRRWRLIIDSGNSVYWNRAVDEAMFYLERKALFQAL